MAPEFGAQESEESTKFQYKLKQAERPAFIFINRDYFSPCKSMFCPARKLTKIP